MATRDELKAYFQTGDKPTQAQFGELIDSLALVTEVEAAANAPSAATAITTEVITSYRTMVDVNGVTFKVAVVE